MTISIEPIGTPNPVDPGLSYAWPGDAQKFEKMLAELGGGNGSADTGARLQFVFNDKKGQYGTKANAQPAETSSKAPQWVRPPEQPGFSNPISVAGKVASRLGGTASAYFSDIPGLNGVKTGQLSGGVDYKFDGGTGILSLRGKDGDLRLDLKSGSDGVFKTPDGEAIARRSQGEDGGIEFNADVLKRLETPEGRAAAQVAFNEETTAGKTPETAAVPGSGIETHTQEERDLVASMQAQGRSNAEIQSALDGLRAKKTIEINLEHTPENNPEKFEPVRGASAKRNKETGEFWQKDRLHNDHYEVYKNRNNYEKAIRDRAVWSDGRLKKKF
ncbi:hypothetical protein JDN40_12395 [Rhodomicrobium vannielii ATCC 17100]|uniref:hypothetical protein n=1 Tax=Rhodomicrobium vannielii TaxID=1069 RepID=UPI00191B7D65|nr:hypothetical protein [Rhodomicrobium vannielii]MBJ7534907.1 hypothetical protein [Rhodomicrobium vannielii ATCC 17100]